MSVEECHENCDSTLFRLKVDNIRELKEEDGKYTNPQMINGLPMEMGVYRWERYDKNGCELTGQLSCMPEDFGADFFFNFAIDFKLVNCIDDLKSRRVADEGRITAKDMSSRFIHLINWKELMDENNGFIQDGAIILEAKIRPERYGIHPHPSFDFFKPSEISDVTLVVEQWKMYVSKQILAHHSSYFMALFFGNFKESAQSKIELKDLVPRDFNCFLKLIYGDKTQIERSDTRNLLLLLDRFDCERLRFDVQVWLIGRSIAYKSKIALASEFRLNYLLDNCMVKLDTSTKIRTLINSAEYPNLTTEIKEELQIKLNNIQELEAKGAAKKAKAGIPDGPSPNNVDFSAPSEISDVVLVVEGKKLHVSSQILAHHSSYFKTFFFSDPKDFKEHEIELKDLVHEDFLIFQNLIYGDKKQLNWSHMNQLLPLLNRFGCDVLKYDAQVCMIGQPRIPIKTKIALACEHQLHFLLDDCMVKMDKSSKIKALMKSEEYGKLTEDIKEELQKKMEKVQKTESDLEMQRAKRPRLYFEYGDEE